MNHQVEFQLVKFIFLNKILANDFFESEPIGQKMTVQISGLSKIYPSGAKALETLSLKLYESSITSLLGHNGAGKTTTM